MTKDLVRYHHTGGFHFLTWSCYRRRPCLASAQQKDDFEHSLETMRLRYGFVVAGYVLMPEHIHLMTSEPSKALLSKALTGFGILESAYSTLSDASDTISANTNCRKGKS